MKGFDEIDKSEMRDLLVRNWMTHDAMWFANALRHCGIEQTNLVNRAAVKSMAAIEARRLKSTFGIDEISSFEDLKNFIVQGFEVIRGPFMNFRLSFPEENVLQWEMPTCFAYEGVSKLGVIDAYQCGIFDRLDGWLESLGIGYTASPAVDSCLLHTRGRCIREYRFSFSR